MAEMTIEEIRTQAEKRGPAIKLVGFDLTGLDFRELRLNKLVGASFIGADLRDAKFTGLDLSGADFRHANLTNADLSGCTLIATQFGNAILRGANLSKCKGGGHFEGADLRDANLREADLRIAIMSGALRFAREE